MIPVKGLRAAPKSAVRAFQLPAMDIQQTPFILSFVYPTGSFKSHTHRPRSGAHGHAKSVSRRCD
eukprot:1162012-Pleurochrysis_carterae.AAC.1